jgi:hypothetical protein
MFCRWATAKAVIAVGVVALNLWFWVFPMKYFFDLHQNSVPFPQ